MHCRGYEQNFSWFVSRCFKPSQPQIIISRLRETFITRFIVERINKAKIRPKEQGGKTGSSRENLWNGIQLKGPLRQKQTREQNKKEWASSVTIPYHVKVSTWGPPEDMNRKVKPDINGWQ